MKVCYVASSGGHWEELMCLSDSFKNFNSAFETEIGGQSEESRLRPLYTLPQINRKEKGFIKHFIQLIKNAICIICEEEPDAIVATGALVDYPFYVIGKIKCAKIIYIESIARLDRKSLIGRLCYPIADLFLIQWSQLHRLYQKAVYVGGIFK